MRCIYASCQDIGMFTFGGLLVANTIEATRLHERIALFVLLKFGSNPKWQVHLLINIILLNFIFKKILPGFFLDLCWLLHFCHFG